jgi:RHS repeat-associated protein
MYNPTYYSNKKQHLQWSIDSVSHNNTSFDSRYKFTAKELDNETNYTYFGARYYDSDLSVWLSVDPLSDKYPSLSPYAYCANNPVILVDPDGMSFDEWEFNLSTGEIAWKSNKGGENVQNINVVSNDKVLFQTQINTSTENVSNIQDISQTENWQLKGVGVYSEVSASCGPFGIAASAGVFSFIGDNSSYGFTDVGVYHGYDLGIGGGLMLIFGPQDMKPIDLDGWSSSATGGVGIVEFGLHTSGNRDGIPTFNYLIITGGASASIPGGGVSWSHTNIYENENSNYWDRPNPACFTSGTEILVPNGVLDIENFNIGDSILSWDFENNLLTVSFVTQKFEAKSNSVYKLTIDSMVVYVTEYHPFYVYNDGWHNVSELKIGDCLMLYNETCVTLNKKEIIPWSKKVYNIEVDNQHNYFVTKKGILVHNK